MKENGFTKKKREEAHKIITFADYADNQALLSNTSVQVKSLLQSLEQLARSIVFYVN